MNRITQEAHKRQTESIFTSGQPSMNAQECDLCTELCPFDKALQAAGIAHVLIPPRTPWHNGKVERSHRNDQRYFYDWEKFSDVKELNEKLRKHLHWSNRKIMRTLGNKSPIELLQEKLAAA